jgi:hypothetical protein
MKGYKMSNILLAIEAVENALGNIGVYPESRTENYGSKDQKTTPRTTWQDGWNACYVEILEKIFDQLRILRKEVDENFALLSLIDAGWMDEDKYVLNMNDTFHYACADCEEVNKEEAKEVVRLFKRYGFKGIDYWVAQKRGYDPEIPRYKEGVEEVRLHESSGKSNTNKIKEDYKCSMCGYDSKTTPEEWRNQIWENEEETCGDCHKTVKHKEGTYRHGFWYHKGQCTINHPY